MANTFDRYYYYRHVNIVENVPFIKIPNKSSDIKIIYRKNNMRLDQISYQYYNSPDYAWFILQANPQFGALEYNIPDGAELRIPYPLSISLDEYKKTIEEYNKYNK